MSKKFALILLGVITFIIVSVGTFVELRINHPTFYLGMFFKLDNIIMRLLYSILLPSIFIFVNKDINWKKLVIGYSIISVVLSTVFLFLRIQ